MAEAPDIISLLEGVSCQNNKICIGYKNQFELIDERTGDILRVHRIEHSAKVLNAYYKKKNSSFTRNFVKLNKI